MEYVIGLVSVSVLLWIIYQASGGAAIGGGDVKLMFATGLLLGWKKNILGFVIGCILGSVIHVIRMKVSKEGHALAMGPYLAAGVAALWGDELIRLYLQLVGF